MPHSLSSTTAAGVRLGRRSFHARPTLRCRCVARCDGTCGRREAAGRGFRRRQRGHHEGDAGERVVFGEHFPTPTGRGLFVPPSGTLAEEQPAALPSAGSVLVTLPWGSGEGQVGLMRVDEGLTRGPEALAVAPDGRIAVRLRPSSFVLVRVGNTADGCGSAGLRVAEADTGGRETIAVSVGVAVFRPPTPWSTSNTIPPSR